MKSYNHKEIEAKWQKIWEKKKPNLAPKKVRQKKFYGLIEFPFPSGEGLHVGHIRSNTAIDIISRKRRGEGYDVLYPIGWDAFGLPTENYAIKMGIHPTIITKKNTDNFRRQLKSLGYSFDWSREINTSSPEYYKWTQWIFLQMFKRGIAYQAETTVWWCEALGTVLANEEVIDGKSERGDHPCIKMPLNQWMLAITKYADRLDRDLDTVNYLEKIKIQQRNWIGKSEGAEIDFKINEDGKSIKVFTTRADTLMGVTYLVLAPEHDLIQDLKSKINNWQKVKEYIDKTKSKSDIARESDSKEKTGVKLEGINAIHPATKEKLPVYIADYVFKDYGTGAVMAVPAHDERDAEFSKVYNLPVKEIEIKDENKKNYGEKYGKIVNKYKLRDWVFSRQRYWGEPFPIVWVNKDDYEKIVRTNGIVAENLPETPVIRAGKYAVAIPEKLLPVKLPNVKSFAPSGDGKSALGTASDWVNVLFNIKTGATKKLPKNYNLKEKGAKADKKPSLWVPAIRETDTMPNWAGSSWYYLRYADPKNKKELASKEALKNWTPVDWYNGGMEHTTLHLLYSRFWHKFLYDIGTVPTIEPYNKRTSHGLILGEGGVKMSKSLGNVVNPDSIVALYGADSLRIYEMFMGPFDQQVAWSTDSIIGSRRFIERLWRTAERVNKKEKINLENNNDKKLLSELQKTIKKISDDIENMSFNTAVSSMMIFLSILEKEEKVNSEIFGTFLRLVAPFAPHVTEELWQIIGNKKSIHDESWPTYNEKLVVEENIKIGVSVNGKIRAEMILLENETEDSIKLRAQELENVKKWLNGGVIKKVIYIPKKMINIVI